MQARIQAQQKQDEKLWSDYKLCALPIIKKNKKQKKTLTYETPFVYHWPISFVITRQQRGNEHAYSWICWVQLMPNAIHPNTLKYIYFYQNKRGEAWIAIFHHAICSIAISRVTMRLKLRIKMSNHEELCKHAPTSPTCKSWSPSGGGICWMSLTSGPAMSWWTILKAKVVRSSLQECWLVDIRGKRGCTQLKKEAFQIWLSGGSVGTAE